MSADHGVSITLTDVQVAQVVRGASRGRGGLAGLLAGLGDLSALQDAVLLLDDEAYSTSTFRTVLTLAAFPADGSERGINDAIAQLGFPAATTHRTVRSLVALGLLEQDPRSRRYRRAQATVERAKATKQ